MPNMERNSENVRCYMCNHFNGLDPSAGEGPEAWCSPPNDTMSRPCNPYAKARNYSCFEMKE